MKNILLLFMLSVFFCPAFGDGKDLLVDKVIHSSFNINDDYLPL